MTAPWFREVVESFQQSDLSRYLETFKYVELSVSSVFDVLRTGTEKQFVGLIFDVSRTWTIQKEAFTCAEEARDILADISNC